MPKRTHYTIIEQYDFMNLVEEMTLKMFDIVLEHQTNRDEYVIFDPDLGETLTQKGEDVYAGFEEDCENIIKSRLQLEFHGNDRERRSKEHLLELPF